MKFLFYLYRFFCSLKLAIFTLSSLIILFAIGTFYESFQGRTGAQEIIYDSFYMNILLSLLALNIIAVMLDRFPWKKKHIPFLLAHFGILFVIAGSFITRFYGVDGYMRLSQGEEGQHITGQDIFLNIYASFDGQNLSRLKREKLFFFRHPPTEEKPYQISLGQDILKVKNFYSSALLREDYQPTLRGGVAVRFLMEGSPAQITRWLFLPPYVEKVEVPVGLARLFLFKSFPSDGSKEWTKGPALLMAPGQEGLDYYLIKSGQKFSKGVLKKGDTLKTGWMDFQFRVLEYWPKALPKRTVIPVKRPNDQTVPAIQVEFRGQSRYLPLNSQVFFFDKNKVYIVAYGQEKQKVDFALKLKSFKIQHYPFSRKAGHYESEVLVDGHAEIFISMNQPLKWGDWTVYQSGFEESEKGEPIASVFSVNKDPGRWIKYGGSLSVVLGALLLFIRRSTRNRPY